MLDRWSRRRFPLTRTLDALGRCAKGPTRIATAPNALSAAIFRFIRAAVRSSL